MSLFWLEALYVSVDFQSWSPGSVVVMRTAEQEIGYCPPIPRSARIGQRAHRYDLISAEVSFVQEFQAPNETGSLRCHCDWTGWPCALL